MAEQIYRIPNRKAVAKQMPSAHAIEENLNAKLTGFTSKLQLLKDIIQIYKTVDAIPADYRQGYLQLKKESEQDYSDLTQNGKLLPLRLIADYGQTMTEAKILKSREYVDQQREETRGKIDPTLVVDLYDQDKQFFQRYRDILSGRAKPEEHEIPLAEHFEQQVQQNPGKFKKKVGFEDENRLLTALEHKYKEQLELLQQNYEQRMELQNIQNQHRIRDLELQLGGREEYSDIENRLGQYAPSQLSSARSSHKSNLFQYQRETEELKNEEQPPQQLPQQLPEQPSESSISRRQVYARVREPGSRVINPIQVTMPEEEIKGGAEGGEEEVKHEEEVKREVLIPVEETKGGAEGGEEDYPQPIDVAYAYHLLEKMQKSDLRKLDDVNRKDLEQITDTLVKIQKFKIHKQMEYSKIEIDLAENIKTRYFQHQTGDDRKNFKGKYGQLYKTITNKDLTLKPLEPPQEPSDEPEQPKQPKQPGVEKIKVSNPVYRSKKRTRETL